MLHPRSYGLSPLTQYGGTVGGIWFWHWSMVFVCRGSWWTVAPYTPTPVPGDEAGVAVGELSTMERDWAQDLSLSLFVIQFTEYFYCLQTFAFAHTHSAARKRCRIYYCSLHKLYYLTSLSFHNERIHIRFHPRVQCVIISVELLLCEVFQLVFLAKLDQGGSTSNFSLAGSLNYGSVDHHFGPVWSNVSTESHSSQRINLKHSQYNLTVVSG